MRIRRLAGMSPVPSGRSGFARDIGGRPFVNTNDAAGAVDQILRDTSIYYGISVQDPAIFRSADVRQLEVRTLRKGLTIPAQRFIPGRIREKESPARATRSRKLDGGCARNGAANRLAPGRRRPEAADVCSRRRAADEWGCAHQEQPPYREGVQTDSACLLRISEKRRRTGVRCAAKRLTTQPTAWLP